MTTRAAVAPAGLALVVIVLASGCTSRDSRPGAVDASFGRAGVQVVRVGRSSEGVAAAVDSDERIVVAGVTVPPPGTGDGDNDLVVVRLDARGRPDDRFGRNGVVAVALPGASVSQVLVQPEDGKIVVAGTSVEPPAAGRVLTLVRLAPDGSRDLSFGDRGVVRLGFDEEVVAVPALRFVDGRILVGAVLDTTVVVAKFGLDGGIGEGGRTIVPLTSGTVAFGPDGAALVSGLDGSRPVLRRLTPQGAPDAAFGTDGAAGTDAEVEVLLVGDDGGATGAFVTSRGTLQGFGLVRFRADGRPDRRFGDEGRTGPMEGNLALSGLVAHPSGALLAVVAYEAGSGFVEAYDGRGVAVGAPLALPASLARPAGATVTAGGDLVVVGASELLPGEGHVTVARLRAAALPS